MNRKRMEKPKWWRRFWPLTIIACSVLIVLDGILYLLGYTALSQLFGVILVVFAAIPLTYWIWHLQIRYQTTKTVQLINKIAFIGTGGFVAWVITFFGGAFIIWAVKGMPKPGDPPPQYPALIFIVIFIVPWIVGGFIGYLIGKRRNYRPYI
jgi:hypothetical protein